MNSRLDYLYNKIEAQRKTLLLSLQSFPYETLNGHPSGKWSINQIIAHLITAENLTIRYLNKKMLGIDNAGNSGLIEEFKMLLLILSQRMPLKFKAPKVVADHTIQETDLIKLIREWDKTRAELKNILEGISDKHLKRKIFRHVRAGMLNIQHTLKFIGEHVGHHTPQIKNLLKQK